MSILYKKSCKRINTKEKANKNIMYIVLNNNGIKYYTGIGMYANSCYSSDSVYRGGRH